MHSMNESRWEMEGVKVISAKSEGKGKMKVVFIDEIVGLAGNGIIDKTMKDFQRKRKLGYTFENPMFVEWEYGKSGDEEGMGYWTSEHMNKFIPEYIEIFEFLYPDHVLLLNIDWSSNHSAMVPDARTLANMRLHAGGEQTVNGELTQMPVFKKMDIERRRYWTQPPIKMVEPCPG